MAYFEYCENCSVPQLMVTIEASRNAAQAANGNIVASESPTQAEAYLQEGQLHVTTLQKATKQLSLFAKSGKKCQSCPV